MNTHLFSTDGNAWETDQNEKVKYVKFDNVVELLDNLVENATTITDSEFESVKLYGTFDLMFSIIKSIILDDLGLNIVSIDMTSPEIDFAIKDSFVLSLVGDEVYIQSAWNGDTMYSNESKYTIVENSALYQKVIDQCNESNDYVVVADFNFI